MKRVLTWLAVCNLAVALVGCGDSAAPAKKAPTPAAVSAPAAAEEKLPEEKPAAEEKLPEEKPAEEKKE